MEKQMVFAGPAPPNALGINGTSWASDRPFEAYLAHIGTNYDNLAGMTYFLPDQQLTPFLAARIGSQDASPRWLGAVTITITLPEDPGEEGCGGDAALRKAWETIFSAPHPARITYPLDMAFAVPLGNLRRRSLPFWVWLAKAHEAGTISQRELGRLWHFVVSGEIPDHF